MAPSILVLGHPKTGTTSLFHRILASWPRPGAAVFEPRTIEELRAQCRPGEPVLAKVLLPTSPAYLATLEQEFDRRILLVRDPRDSLVSAMLYFGAYHTLWERPAAEIAACLAVLREKERRPASHSVLDLYRTLDPSVGAEGLVALFARLLPEVVRLADSGRYLVLPYEELVRDRLEPLEAYMGFGLGRGKAVPEGYRRVLRTGASGSWRTWFRPADVACFHAVFADFLVRFGYPTSWELDPDPVIPAAHASGYVLRLLAERGVEVEPAPG